MRLYNRINNVAVREQDSDKEKLSEIPAEELRSASRMYFYRIFALFLIRITYLQKYDLYDMPNNLDLENVLLA